MRSIPLDGLWRLYHLPEHDSTLQTPADLLAAALPAVPAEVPGNVELDLYRAGEIPDPFYAQNIQALRALETHQWWYLREFECPADLNGAWELVCEGLDTLATIWLNGVEIGRCANALIEQRFTTGAALKPGPNQLVIRLGSAFNAARAHSYDALSMSWESREEGLFIRKPPHCWGWDIMPRAVSAGIWRSIRLEERPAESIEQLYYWTRAIDSHGATLGVRYQFRSAAATLEGFHLQFEGVCGEHHFHFDWPVEFVAGGLNLPVADARLWWPKGYGAPDLYTITARLMQADRVLAERVERVGIRLLTVQRTELGGQPFTPPPVEEAPQRVDSPVNPQSCFLFRVNGTPIQVRGSNWVPLDAFHSRDLPRLEAALALVDDLGCNMLRCWGGNVYESERFFELCDERGLLVWQDFAFACCRYPQTTAFLEEVRREVEAVAVRLRNHACLAIWCGDNEIDMAYHSDGLDPAHNRLTREVIPHALQRSDPYRAYVPSSPYVPPALKGVANAWQRTPEQHLWGPRGYFKNVFYTGHNAHFIGEIGYHGCPNVSSIRRFISPEHLWPWQDNPEWHAHEVYHWQHARIERDRIQLMANQVKELFGEIPADLATFALASQITQAEAKKYFVESTRLRKWHTSGVLWWNVLDGWPQFSDAIVDYYFSKKLAYHYLRRVQAPVCLLIGEPGAGKYLPLVVCNDTREDARLTYRVRQGDELLLEGAAEVPAGQNWQVGRLRTYASDQRLYLLEWSWDGQAFGNHYLSGTPPFSLATYRGWLEEIAALPRPFRAAEVGQTE